MPNREDTNVLKFFFADWLCPEIKANKLTRNAMGGIRYTTQEKALSNFV